MSRPQNPEPWQPSFHGHPLFAGLRSICAGFKGSVANAGWPTLEALNGMAAARQITNHAGLPVQFVPQGERLSQRAYEQQIGQTGCVPTRTANWHDFLNACAWLTYPALKAAINAVHGAQSPSSVRSKASDAATVFDESGAILLGPDPRLAKWLREHNWQEAFVTHRDLWRTHRLLVVGHAVLEKTLQPYPGMITKVLYQPWPAINTTTTDEPPEGLDATVAKRWLAGEFESAATLFALPVLGVPGVDPASEKTSYYDNTAVFRPRRTPDSKDRCRLKSST